MTIKSIDTWKDDAGTTYDVNIDNGWVNVEQAEKIAKDVLAAIAPVDAFRLAKALIKAANEAEKHPRWMTTCTRCGIEEQRTPEKTLFGGLCGKCESAEATA